MQYTIETVLKIYDNESGEFWEVRPDRDRLGLVEIIAYDGEGTKEHSHMTFPPELAEIIGKEIIAMAAKF